MPLFSISVLKLLSKSGNSKGFPLKVCGVCFSASHLPMLGQISWYQKLVALKVARYAEVGQLQSTIQSTIMQNSMSRSYVDNEYHLKL